MRQKVLKKIPTEGEFFYEIFNFVIGQFNIARFLTFQISVRLLINRIPDYLIDDDMKIGVLFSSMGYRILGVKEMMPFYLSEYEY